MADDVAEIHEIGVATATLFQAIEHLDRQRVDLEQTAQVKQDRRRAPRDAIETVERVLAQQQRFVRFVADARAGRLQMPPLPALPQMPQMPQPRSAISRGGRAAVRFVNAIKTPKRVIPMI